MEFTKDTKDDTKKTIIIGPNFPMGICPICENEIEYDNNHWKCPCCHATGTEQREFFNVRLGNGTPVIIISKSEGNQSAKLGILRELITKEVMFPSDAAALLGISKASLSNMVARGSLPFIVHPCGKSIFLRSELEEYLQAKKQAGKWKNRRRDEKTQKGDLL